MIILHGFVVGFDFEARIIKCSAVSVKTKIKDDNDTTTTPKDDTSLDTDTVGQKLESLRIII